MTQENPTIPTINNALITTQKPCICSHYLTQPLLGISGAIAPEKLTLYLFTLSHSTITRDYWSDSEALLQAVRSLKTLPCICLRYLTQALLGMFRAIAKRCCKQFAVIVLVH
ncbi:hypothetical protein ANA_C11854 [Anabaena sp. 90]|uniref:hypothetical protein n=1 Tax=Anabaena sp. 90 TaxID=46234 RepID=UPI00029B584D|nr:hypothetical protein [Anabaena sp. 90]AFW94611.1 hypothetical protein ANA_C11854 [Anabaena sp. 90]